MSIGSIGIQTLTASRGTPRQASSEADNRKIDPSVDPTAVAADESARQAPAPGTGRLVDKLV